MSMPNCVNTFFGAIPGILSLTMVPLPWPVGSPSGKCLTRPQQRDKRERNTRQRTCILPISTRITVCLNKSRQQHAILRWSNNFARKQVGCPISSDFERERFRRGFNKLDRLPPSNIIYFGFKTCQTG